MVEIGEQIKSAAGLHHCHTVEWPFGQIERLGESGLEALQFSLVDAEQFNLGLFVGGDLHHLSVNHLKMSVDVRMAF